MADFSRLESLCDQIVKLATEGAVALQGQDADSAVEILRQHNIALGLTWAHVTGLQRVAREGQS